jgi:hypothetical protein
MHEMDLKDLPRSIEDCLQYVDEDQANVQFRHVRNKSTWARADSSVGRGGLFPGHGDDETDTKDNILMFFRWIDKGLRSVLHDERAPMVLAGVEFLLPLYREANTYAHVLDAGILGNPEGKSAQQLHAEAWPLVEPHFQQQQRQDVERYNELAATHRTSHDLKQIVPAAYDGRVDALFVAVDHQRWGTFKPETHEVELHLEARPGDADLLDLAAAHTLLGGGKVYAMPYEQMPDQVLLAAIYRY